MSSRYDVFMSAFNDIEAFLQHSLYGRREDAPGFRTVLEEFRRKRARHIRERQYEELVLLAELRNALTHGQRVNHQPLAEPTETAVLAIQRLRDELRSPMTVLAALKRNKPVIVSPDDSVRAALDTMYAHDFSQVPVYNGNTYAGLLTTNTVARWVADQMRQHDGLAEDVPVHAVLKFSEGIERVLHLPRHLSTTEAVWRFTTAAEEGRPITALIITHGGRPDESPLGIVVAEDLARLSG